MAMIHKTIVHEKCHKRFADDDMEIFGGSVAEKVIAD
jgi:hypothetical protein